MFRYLIKRLGASIFQGKREVAHGTLSIERLEEYRRHYDVEIYLHI